jgi:hypothetical protein
VVKNNILETQIRKVIYQYDEEFARMLAVLGYDEPVEEGVLLRQLGDRLDDCVNERD